MKRRSYLLLGGLLLITASFWLLHDLSHTVIPATGSRQQKTNPFSGFPEGKAVNIDFGMQYNYTVNLNRRERVDQLRDWLLYSILTDAGLSTQELGQLTYDLPVTRAGYNENIANFDYTRTRSRNIGNGVVVALIPAGSPEEERASIAHVADEQQKNAGSPPSAVIPFVYRIDLADNRALLTRGTSIPGDSIYTAAYGYYILKVTNKEELGAFLEHTRDLVYVKDLPDGVVLGGRMLDGGSTRNVTLQDIAALYQSEEKIKTGVAGEHGEVTASGFSLDPSYNYDSLSWVFKKIVDSLQPYDNANELGGIYRSILQKDVGPLIGFLYELKQRPDKNAQDMAEAVLSVVREHSQFQKARYDGDLKGTEVGMHLFYTDLLAKLWSIDYRTSSPEDAIYGFVNDVSNAAGLSRVFERESDSFPSCRLWFGPNNSGFQKVGVDDRLLFARNATRVYSASSDPFQPGKEVPVSAFFAGCMNWMNGHFEEVAAYEQEYQILNEIMKWSLVIGWLNANEMGNKLQFLTDVTVRRDHIFTEWVREHPELRFSDWSSIGFYPPGYSGAETEAMPVLYRYYLSKKGVGELYGGVSLAEREAIKSTASLSEDVNVLLRRSNLDYSAASNEIRFLKGPKYDFEATAAGGDYQIVAKAAEDTRIRGHFGELNNEDFERTIVPDGNSMKMEFSQKSIPIGSLDVERMENGFSIGFRSRDMERVQSFARDVSDAADPHGFITGADNSEAYVTLAENVDYLVKIKGSDNWARIRLQDEPEVFLDKDWDSRVAGNGKDSKICLVKFMNEREAKTLAGTHTIRYKPAYGTDRVAASFGTGKYAEVIGDFREDFRETGDIGGIKTRLRVKYLADLRALDQTQTGEEYAAAFDELRATYGNTPEIKIREALLRLQGGELDEAEELINHTFSHGLKADGDFFADLRAMIDHTNLSNQNQQMLYSVLQLNGGRDLQVASLHFDALPAGKSTDIRDLISQAGKGKARVIVENSPGLNNIDWNAAIHSPGMVNRLPAGLRVLEMEETSLAGYRYELKIVPAADHSGTYEFKVSAKMHAPAGVRNQGNNDDSTQHRPTYYLYLPDRANSRA